MNRSNAERLLGLAANEADRLIRHLFVAAALREVMDTDPIVVGGTAEEYWTAAAYHETDLDLCAPVSGRDASTLEELGFEREGRHWVWGGPERWVAVEFRNSMVDGDESRTRDVPVGNGAARVIGLDDLYLDRLRQATIDERAERVEFNSALAVVAARYAELDWAYIRARMRHIAATEAPLAAAMKRIDSRIRRRVRRALASD